MRRPFLKHLVDENEAQKREYERRNTKDADRQVLAERKLNENTFVVTRRKLTTVKEDVEQPKRSFSTLKFGGGSTLVSVDCADDIDRYMRFLENRNKLSPQFLSLQKGIVDGRMRQILVDWLIHVQIRFQLSNEALSLAVHLLDHSLISLEGISKSNLQLVGVGCLFVAAKFEEITVPILDDFVFVAANVFSKADILLMEQRILKEVGYDLSHPHAIHFMRRYRFFVNPRQEVWALAKLISEVALISYSLAHHPPSTVAAVSLYLASYTFGFPLTSPFLFSDVFRISEAEVVGTARSFVSQVVLYIDSATKLFSLRAKYEKVLTMINDKHVNRLNDFGDNFT